MSTNVYHIIYLDEHNLMHKNGIFYISYPVDYLTFFGIFRLIDFFSYFIRWFIRVA